MPLLALGSLFALFGPPTPGTVAQPPADDTAIGGTERKLQRWRRSSAVRIDKASEHQWAWLRARSLDDWSDWGPGNDIVLPQSLLAELSLRGIEHKVLVPDLETQALEERERLVRNAQRPRPSILSPEFFDDFLPLATLQSGWAELAAAYPDRVELVRTGYTIEGRKLQALRIGSPNAPRSVLFVFGQHAREWISPATATCFAARAAMDASALHAQLLEEVQVWLVPLANPDGYAFTWADDRFWRKNRRPPEGVDLNRNWSSAFGIEPGSSSDPTSNSYRGQFAFSEAETAAVRQLAHDLVDLRAYVDIHSYSQLVLYPLSYLSEVVPDSQGRARAWAEANAQTMSDVHGVVYTPLRGSDLYPAAGVSMDWASDRFSVPSFTYELRPDGDFPFPDGFVLPPDQIVQTCDEVEAALWQITRWAQDGGPEPVAPPKPNPPEPPPEPWDSGPKPNGDDDAGSESVGTQGARPAPFDTVKTGCACQLERGARGRQGAAWLFFAGLICLRRRRTDVGHRHSL